MQNQVSSIESVSGLKYFFIGMHILTGSILYTLYQYWSYCMADLYIKCWDPVLNIYLLGEIIEIDESVAATLTCSLGVVKR